MIYKKYIAIEEFCNSGKSDEYQYLYKKDSELKGNNYEDGDDDDSDIVYGINFLICKIIDKRQI